VPREDIPLRAAESVPQHVTTIAVRAGRWLIQVQLFKSATSFLVIDWAYLSPRFQEVDSQTPPEPS
jgi:hypothetical protein